MVRSVTRGNAGQGAWAGGNGAMPVMAGDEAFRDGEPSQRSTVTNGRGMMGRAAGACAGLHQPPAARAGAPA
jgi:hypothetical protein